jgi:hypothetical protein
MSLKLYRLAQNIRKEVEAVKLKWRREKEELKKVSFIENGYQKVQVSLDQVVSENLNNSNSDVGGVSLQPSSDVNSKKVSYNYHFFITKPA